MSEFNIKVDAGSSVRLPTAGKYCDRDIVVRATDGDLKNLIERNPTKIAFPSNLTRIGNSAFRNFFELTLTSLPERVTEIDHMAFQNCKRLALTSLPSNLQYIGNSAFDNCTSLKKLTFKSTPYSISAIAFDKCTNLTTINVPWAEGEVANAPWGATNATINYNYTGG